MTELLVATALVLLGLVVHAQGRPQAYWENQADATDGLGWLWFALLAMLAWRTE